jgi:hypothetical protein
MAAAYERKQRAFDALQRSVASLAESLERPMPNLEAERKLEEHAAHEEGSVTVLTGRVSPRNKVSPLAMSSLNVPVYAGSGLAAYVA